MSGPRFVRNLRASAIAILWLGLLMSSEQINAFARPLAV